VPGWHWAWTLRGDASANLATDGEGSCLVDSPLPLAGSCLVDSPLPLAVVEGFCEALCDAFCEALCEALCDAFCDAFCEALVLAFCASLPERALPFMDVDVRLGLR